MKVLVAGGSGALGRRLVPMLVAAGHEVGATSRSPRKQDELRSLGAEAAVLDALDAQAVVDAVANIAPEVVVHELTALPRVTNLRHWDRDFSLTNRLRTEGTDHLIHAAQLAGVRRLVAQSFTGWPNVRAGGSVKDEDDPLDPDPPAAMRESLEAIRHLEQVVLDADGFEGVVLRYGSLYGPGTAMTNEYSELIRKRRFPRSATARACGRSFTSTTRRRPRWPRSSAARPGSTTSSTTTRRRLRSGCRAWRTCSARRLRAAFRSGSAGSRPARWASR
jgi:2-alkyl-3-oxoalkanoate reductase